MEQEDAGGIKEEIQLGIHVRVCVCVCVYRDGGRETKLKLKAFERLMEDGAVCHLAFLLIFFLLKHLDILTQKYNIHINLSLFLHGKTSRKKSENVFI